MTVRFGCECPLEKLTVDAFSFQCPKHKMRWPRHINKLSDAEKQIEELKEQIDGYTLSKTLDDAFLNLEMKAQLREANKVIGDQASINVKLNSKFIALNNQIFKASKVISSLLSLTSRDVVWDSYDAVDKLIIKKAREHKEKYK